MISWATPTQQAGVAVLVRNPAATRRGPKVAFVSILPLESKAKEELRCFQPLSRDRPRKQTCESVPSFR